MVVKGCQPDLFTYGVVVNGICKRSNTDFALYLLRKMEEGKINIVVIYSKIVDALCKYKQSSNVVLVGSTIFVILICKYKLSLYLSSCFHFGPLFLMVKWND